MKENREDNVGLRGRQSLLITSHLLKTILSNFISDHYGKPMTDQGTLCKIPWKDNIDQSHYGCANMNNRPLGPSCPTKLDNNGKGSHFRYCNTMSNIRECLKKGGKQID